MKTKQHQHWRIKRNKALRERKSKKEKDLRKKDETRNASKSRTNGNSNPNNKRKIKRFRKFKKLVDRVFTLSIKLVSLFIFFLFFVVIILHLTDDKYLLKVELPSEIFDNISEIGFKKLVIDEIEKVELELLSDDDIKKESGLKGTEFLDIEIPGTGISFLSFSEALNLKKTINCNVYKSAGLVRATISIDGQRLTDDITISKSSMALDTLAQKISYAILKKSSPLFLSYYLAEQGEYDLCRRIAFEEAKSDDLKKVAKAYNCIGNSYNLELFNKIDIIDTLLIYKQAQFYYQKSIESDSMYFAPHDNLGVLELRMGNVVEFNGYLDSALVYFQKAISIDSFENAKTFNNLAYTYNLLGNFNDAEKYAKKAIRIAESKLDSKRLLSIYQSTLCEIYFRNRHVNGDEYLIWIEKSMRNEFPLLEQWKYGIYRNELLKDEKFLKLVKRFYPPKEVRFILDEVKRNKK